MPDEGRPAAERVDHAEVLQTKASGVVKFGTHERSRCRCQRCGHPLLGEGDNLDPIRDAHRLAQVPRGVRLQHRGVRDVWVLQCPNWYWIQLHDAISSQRNTFSDSDADS